MRRPNEDPLRFVKTIRAEDGKDYPAPSEILMWTLMLDVSDAELEDTLYALDEIVETGLEVEAGIVQNHKGLCFTTFYQPTDQIDPHYM